MKPALTATYAAFFIYSMFTWKVPPIGYYLGRSIVILRSLVICSKGYFSLAKADVSLKVILI